MDGMLQILGFSAAGVLAAAIAIMLTRVAFGLVTRKDPPRIVDRLVALVPACAAMIGPAFVGVIAVMSVDAFQEHRTNSLAAYLLFWIVPHGWYVFKNRPHSK